MKSFFTTFPPLEELLSNEKLADKTLLVDPVQIPAKESKSFESDKLPIVFSISAQGEMSVQLFNDENDKDDLQLVNYQESSFISLDTTKDAYLKYSIKVYPKSKLKGTIEDIGLEINKEKGISLSYYKKHSNQKTIKEAIQEDLSAFPSFFNSMELNKLKSQDAFAYNIEGEFKAKGEISWSDLLSKSVNLIPSVFSKSVSLDLSISPKLTASFDLSFKDHFSYVLKRNANGSFSVSINKIKNSTIGGGVGASIGVKISNLESFEKQVEELLESVITSLTNKTPKFIGKALEAFEAGSANSSETEALEKLAKLVALEDWKERIEDLFQKWEEIQGKFKKGLKESAEIGAMLTFSFEFKRINEGTEIFKATLDNEKELGSYHADFLKFDIKPLLSDLRQEKNNGITIEKYFNQTKVITESALGFGLKIWKNDFLKGKDFSKKEEIIRQDLRNHRQVTLTAIRGYDWKIGNKGGKWLSQLEASMPSFSLGLEPRLSEFQFTWTLKSYLENFKIKSKGDLKKLLNSASNWGCISPSDIEPLVEKHFNTFEKVKISFQKQIYFNDQILKSLFKEIYSHGFDEVIKKSISKSLAASLPYFDGILERTNPILRENLYSPVWSYFLDHPKTSFKSLAQITADHLEDLTQSRSLVDAEKKAGNNNQGIWLADVIYTNSNLYYDLLSFLEGMRQIGEGMVLGIPLNKQLENSYDKIDNFLQQSFYQEVIGNFLLRLIKENPVLAMYVEKTLSFSFGEDEATKTIHIGQT